MVNVIGLGYIGLPTALMMAANGVQVTGTDCNQDIVRDLRDGKIHFEEKGLANIFQKAQTNGIAFGMKYIYADQYIVAVPSPHNVKTKKVDTRYIESAINRILEVAPPDAIIIVESTVSPGTIDRSIRPLIAKSEKKNIRLAHAPERIIPGNMVHELIYNHRAIGADDERTRQQVKELYSSFCRGTITLTDIKTAEMTKVVENTFRDVNIAFANELCKICDDAGVDVHEVIQIANQHPRVNILSPGPGVGGHCIAVDPWFLVGDYPGIAELILAARKVNSSMPDYILKRIFEIMKRYGISDAARVGLYGLTYKENVNDIRESPTLQMIDIMQRHLAFGVQVYDPLIKVKKVENQWFDFDGFLAYVDLVVVMVAHDEIMESVDKLQGKVVFDTRDCLTLSKEVKLIKL